MALIMVTSSKSGHSSNFASVKLPNRLVQDAKDAAQPLRRSAAGQIEYWATLGRVVEHSGLTVQEARDAIEVYEAAVHEARQARLNLSVEDTQASELITRFMVVETNGSLAQRVRKVVSEKQRKACPAVA